MDRRKELSATEKLLDLIRAGDDPIKPRRDMSAAAADDGAGPAADSSLSSPASVSPPQHPAVEAPAAGRRFPRFLSSARSAFSAAWLRLSAGMPGLGRYHNRVTVGVSLRPGLVELAVVGQVRGRPLLQDHLAYEVEQEKGGAADDNDNWLDAPALKNTLRRALEVARAGQTGRPRHLEIWAELPWRQVDVHLLDIPKVTSAEITNAVFWAARKNIEGFDPQKQILDFILSPRSQNHDKQRAVVFLAGRRQVEKMRQLFRSLNFPLAGITAPAVTVSNLAEKERLAGPAKVFSHLRLEENNSFISLFEDHKLAFSRDIKTGLLSILEVEPATNGNLNGDREKAQPPSPASAFSQDQQPVFDLGLDTPTEAEAENGTDQEIEFSLDDEPAASPAPPPAPELPPDNDSQLVLSLEVAGEEDPASLVRPDQTPGTVQDPDPEQGGVREAGEPVPEAAESTAINDDEIEEEIDDGIDDGGGPPAGSVPDPAFDSRALTRLLRQLERTFDYCGTNLGIARPEQIYVSSPVRLGPSLLAKVEGELGIGCAWLDPFAHDQGIGTLAAAPPAGNHRRQLLASAVGLAFADQHRSQNFLLTYPDKEKSRLAHKVNQLIITVFIVLALGLTGVYWGQQTTIGELRQEREALEGQRRQLAATQYDEPYLAAMAAEIRRHQDEITALARRQQLLLLLTEAQQRRPDDVLLQQLRVWVGDSGPEADKVQLEVRGVIGGRSAERALQLARYLRRLEASKQIQAARIVERRERETPTMEKVISFTLQMEARPLAIDGE